MKRRCVLLLFCWAGAVIAVAGDKGTIAVAVAERSTMATSHLLKGFGASCPNVSIVLDESTADYVIVAQDTKDTELMKHYRITLFNKQGKAVFGTDKHSPGAATKEVCKFLNAK